MISVRVGCMGVVVVMMVVIMIVIVAAVSVRHGRRSSVAGSSQYS